MGKQVADGDVLCGPGVCQAEPGQVALEGSAGVELAGVDQLANRQRGDGLADRADLHGGLDRHGTAVRAAHAKGGEVDDLPILDDPVGQTWNGGCLHLALDVPVDVREVTSRWPCAGSRARLRRCEEQYDKEESEYERRD